MEGNQPKLNIIIHNGREKSFDLERMKVFELKSIANKFFRDFDELETSSFLEKLGPCGCDYTDIHYWSKEIPDIDPRSARLFTLWAEDPDSGEVVGIVRGFFVVTPYLIDRVGSYFDFQDGITYYPMAVVSSIKTIYQEARNIDLFLDQIYEGISSNWKNLREKTIKRLPKGSDLQKRYVLAFDEVIHFTFLCPSIDRYIIEALERKNYRISGVLQLLASPSPSYDDATIKSHLQSATRILGQIQKDDD